MRALDKAASLTRGRYAVRSRLSLIARDLRGLGGTTRATGVFDLLTLVADRASLLAALGVDAERLPAFF